MSSRRGGAAAGGLAAAGKGAADSAGSAGGGPALAGALLCADRAFAGRPGFTPATLAARAATLGLHPAPAAAAAGAPSQAVKRARIAAASRAAAAGVLRSAAAAVADDSWDAVADDAAAAGGAAAATAAAETLALDDPQNGSPEPLQFVASQLRRAARERCVGSGPCRSIHLACCNLGPAPSSPVAGRRPTPLSPPTSLTPPARHSSPLPPQTPGGLPAAAAMARTTRSAGTARRRRTRRCGLCWASRPSPDLACPCERPQRRPRAGWATRRWRRCCGRPAACSSRRLLFR